MIYSPHTILPSFLDAFGDSFLLTGLLYLVMWAGLPALGAYFVQKSGRNFFHISVGSVVFWMMFLLSHLGLAILFFELDPHRVVDQYNNKDIIALTTFYSGLSILLVSIGLYISSFFPKLKPAHDLRDKIWIKSPATLPYFLLAFGGVCALVTLLFMSRLETIPIFLLLGISEGGIDAARSAGGNAFQGRAYIYNLFIQDIPPFLAAIAWALYREKTKFLNLVIFLILFSLTVFGAVLLTAKGGLVFFLIMLMITHYLTKGGKVNPRPLIITGTISFGLMMLMMQLIFMPNDTFARVFIAVLSRALAGGYESYQYLIIFPDKIDFLMGRAFPNPGGVFPFENFPLTFEVQNYLHPELINLGVQGSAPTMFWGDFYANFGFAGILLFSPIIGIIIGGFDGIFSRMANSTLKYAFISWAIIHLSYLSITSSLYLLLDTSLLAVFATFIFISLMGRIPVAVNARTIPSSQDIPCNPLK